MVTPLLYTVLIVLTSIERLIEVRLSNRNTKWSFEQGGIERGKEHFPFMVVLHTAFLVGCVAEVWFLETKFNPMLGYPMLVLAILCQGLRWWCITTLGNRWNTRVIIVPGLKRLSGGPYRFFNHPNYVAVVLEGIALPLIFSAYWTAAIFTILNACLLFVRIRCEEHALQELLEKKT